MPRIKITGRLPKAALGFETTNTTTTMPPTINGPGDDPWIGQIMDYEQNQGGYNSKTGKSFGLPNWGYNSRLPLDETGTIKQPINPITKKPWQRGDAIDYFKQDILPQVQQFPMGMRERLGDYKYNTGRNINDLLLYNAGKITLDDLNSNKTFDEEWDKHKGEIEKMYSDPTFINKLDESKDAIYKSTGSYSDPSQSDPNKRSHYSTNNPNPAYDATWKGRTTMFPKLTVPQQSTPSVKQAVTQTSVPTASVPNQDEEIDYAAKLPNFTKMIGEKYGKPAQIPTINFKNNLNDVAPPEMSTEEKLQATQDKNYENWMQNPQNEMSQFSFAQPFQQKFNLNPQYNSSKFYDGKGKEVNDSDSQHLNWRQKFGKWAGKAAGNVNKALEGPAKLASSIQTGLGVTGAISSYINNEKIADEMKRRQLQSRFNAPVVNPEGTVGSRGDYTQEGTYDPRRYVVNKGMYTNELTPGLSLGEYGGELNQMAYGGDIIEQAIPDMPLDLISLDATSKQSSSKPSLESNLSNVDAVPNSNSEYMLPLQKFTITSGYGRRKPPKGPKGFASSFHNGVDLGVGINTDVFAPMNGVVKSIYSDGNGGNQLIIEHEDGSRTGYAHLNSYKVKIGDNVSKGQVIAFSGNTGNSNGPHLHFTYRNPSGDLVDPTTIFNFNIDSPKQKKSTESVDPTVTNNPLNIHYGDFTKQYGATLGGQDNGGYIAAFPNPKTGVKAAKDLLMGGGYAGSGLTISQARNKWVSGDPNVTNPSTADIVRSMGGDKKLIDLSPEEFNKLLIQFAKWENSKSPDIIKRYSFKEGGEVNTMNTYNEGEEYELTEDEIRDILNNGGDVQFI